MRHQSSKSPLSKIGRLFFGSGAAIVLIFLVMACSFEPAKPPSDSTARPEIVPFTDVAQTIMKNRNEVWNARPGVVIFDYDRDGDADFYISNGHGYGNWLYRNNGDGTFDNVGDEAGVAARQSNSTGVVACDVNNDGFQDLYVGAQGSQTDLLDYRSEVEDGQNVDRLFLNNGDGTFTDITESAFGAGVNVRSAMTVVCADVDNDGWVDFYVGNLAEDEFRAMHKPFQAGHFNVLYRNNGDQTFTDVAERAGVRGPQISMRYPDGQPVVYQDPNTGVTYEGYDPTMIDDQGNQVGDPTGQTQAVLFYDYDSDGDVDLWVANDGDRLHLFRNDSSPGDIKFTSVAREMGIDLVGAWMGFAVGDYDGDSDLDVFVVNVGYHPRLEKPPTTPRPYCAYHERFSWGTCQHFLLRNDGTREVPGLGTVGMYHDVASSTWVEPSPLLPPDSLDVSRVNPEQMVPTGLSAYDFGFGTTFFDYDNDTDQDLYWLGSTVDRGEAPGGEVFPAAGRMLRNLDNSEFEDITVRAHLLDIQRVIYDRIDPADPKRDALIHRGNILAYHENGKGLAHGDLNGDGYLDLIGTNSKGALWEDASQVSFYETGGPIFVWMNPGGDSNYLNLRLQGRMAIDGTGSNADGIGARVYLTSTGGDGESIVQVQEVRAGSSYISMDSIELEFGLGKAEKADEITIRWPSGREQVLQNVDANQTVLVTEPDR